MKIKRFKRSVTLVAVFLIVSVANAAQSSNQVLADQYYQIGYQHFGRGEYHLAAKYFSDSFITARNSLSAYMLSVTYLEINDLRAAGYWARLALEVRPPLAPNLMEAMRSVRSDLEELEGASITSIGGRASGGEGEEKGGTGLPIPSPYHLQWW